MAHSKPGVSNTRAACGPPNANDKSGFAVITFVLNLATERICLDTTGHCHIVIKSLKRHVYQMSHELMKDIDLYLSQVFNQGLTFRHKFR
jgi:hypothetical protein